MGDLAAGNTIVLKPAEVAQATEQLLATLISKYFKKEYFAVVTGDKEVSDSLVGMRFAYIFFTGSNQVGKESMKRPSENITPLTLESAGKSTAMITRDTD